MKTRLAGILYLLSAAAMASGGGGSSAGEMSAPAPHHDTQQQLQQVERLVKEKQWPQAEAILKDLRHSAAKSADVWNWSGYVARKSGRLADAFPYYYQALDIDPKHLGAHEYLGEAYLQKGERQRAQDQLHILQGLCGNCEQAEDLAKALKATP